MKVYVDLTDNELRALRTCMAYSNRCCLSGCVYQEMKQRRVECHNCEFTKNVDKVIKKFNNLKSLADYTKQVRKQVIEKLKIESPYCHINCEDYYKVYPEILDKIIGETDAKD